MSKGKWSLASLLVIGTSVMCASAAEPAAAPSGVQAGWSGGSDFYSLYESYMGDGLEMAIIPTPKAVVYSKKLFPVTKTVVVLPDNYNYVGITNAVEQLAAPQKTVIKASAWQDSNDADLVIVVGGERNPLAAKWLQKFGAAATAAQKQEMGKEGYVLVVTKDGNRMVAILAGNEPAGDFWALQSLKQLFFEGKILGAWMRDWPSFAARGSKERRCYMPNYKDNFSWGGDSNSCAALVANFGSFVPFIAPGGALDCSDAVLDQNEKYFAALYAGGARVLAVKFDDVVIGMEPKTEARFKGDYGAALTYFMREMDKRVKKIDPQCKLYYLPQYYFSSSAYGDLAAQIRKAGGLPADTGMCWTGPQVFSTTVPLKDCKDYMEAFGCTKTKGLIYDNYGRAGDYFPINGRGADLVQCLDGIFSENSTMFNRITRCDYNWNPEAYDPDRALKLACRDSINRDPKTFKALYSFIKYFEDNRYLAMKLSREEKLKKMKEVDAKLEVLLADLHACPTTFGETRRFDEAVRARSSKEALMATIGYRDATVKRAEAAPVLDGKLDDACWKAAAPMKDFIYWDQDHWLNWNMTGKEGEKQLLGNSWGKGAKAGTKVENRMAYRVEDEHQTFVYLTYDDKNLYIAANLKSDIADEMTNCCSLSSRAAGRYKERIWWTSKDPKERDWYGVWHSPSLEFFLSPTCDMFNSYHMMIGRSGLTWDKFSALSEVLWNPDWNIKITQHTEDKGWTLEASIPLENLGVSKIQKGDVWTCNFHRNWPDHQMWSFLWTPKGFDSPEDFGQITFE